MKTFQLAWIAVLICFSSVCASAEADLKGVTRVSISGNQIAITLRSLTSFKLVELQPYEPTSTALARPSLAEGKRGYRTVTIPRFDGDRDRIYSGFVALSEGKVLGHKRFVEEFKGVSDFNWAYPKTTSKKGLQVQMVDDAIALGVKHAALNFNLGNVIQLRPTANDFTWKSDGRNFHFQSDAIKRMDERVKRLSDDGMIVTLILLYYKNADPELNKIMLHPQYDHAAPQHLSAFNTKTPEGLAWFKATIEFVANRYSQPNREFGRVSNYIVGNEVNSHWHWSNMGRVTMDEFARDYLRTVRVCHAAVRKASASSRIFISLEHHWAERYPGGDELQTFAGKPFLDHFAMLSRTYGDIDWGVAYHPYPENLFEPRTWNDKSAHMTFDTPRITFKNIEILPEYMKRPDLRYNGRTRRIILSEQGFHSNETPEGERQQAAAYCYAFYKIDRIPAIDSFILHRHVDHGHEGGLNLGLWRRNKEGGSPAEPHSKKPIYEVFRKAGTKKWEEAFAFALPVIGIKDWKEIEPRKVMPQSR